MSRFGQRLVSRSRIVGDPPLERLVEHERRARRTRRRPRAVRSSSVGPSPPLVTTRSIPCAGEEVERGAQVLGPVADDDRVGVVDAEVAQALGQPRPVAVEHAAGEHLGARDDDARRGRSRSAAGARRPLRGGQVAPARCG